MDLNTEACDDIFFDDDFISDMINDKNFLLNFIVEPESPFHPAELIGHFQIRSKSGILIDPRLNHLEVNQGENDVEQAFELLPNIVKGRWYVARVSFNKPFDVYILQSNLHPENYEQVNIRKISALRAPSNYFGFHSMPLKHPTSYQYLDGSPKGEYEITTSGISIRTYDDDFPVFGFPVSAIISEYDNKVFRIIIVR